MMKTLKYIGITLLIFSLSISSCKPKNKQIVAPIVEDQTITFNRADYLKNNDFDTILKGKEVKLLWIKNGNCQAAFTNFGARLVGLWVPNKESKMTDVVVGLGSIKGFLESTERFFGTTIGRVGNRIEKGKYKIDGIEYSAPINNGVNTLHGGHNGFHEIVWDVEQPNEHTLVFKYLSKHMDQGFPGNLNVQVEYSLTKDNALKIEYSATTDKTTIVNLTNHAFFNLNGEGSGTILNHTLTIHADQFTPVDEGLIPTGELRDVKGTPFDFVSKPYTIGERITTDNQQLEYGKGYDHNYVLNHTKKNGLNHAATIVGDKSGISMEILTEEPGLQFYSGNFMKSANTFKSGAKDDFRTAFALETQHFPDAPNHNNFPSILLAPNETYHTVSIYKFSTK